MYLSGGTDAAPGQSLQQLRDNETSPNVNASVPLLLLLESICVATLAGSRWRRYLYGNTTVDICLDSIGCLRMSSSAVIAVKRSIAMRCITGRLTTKAAQSVKFLIYQSIDTIFSMYT